MIYNSGSIYILCSHIIFYIKNYLLYFYSNIETLKRVRDPKLWCMCWNNSLVSVVICFYITSDRLWRTRWTWLCESYRRLSRHPLLSKPAAAHLLGRLRTLPSMRCWSCIWSFVPFLFIFQCDCPSLVINVFDWWKPLITCPDLFTPTINRLPARLPSNQHMNHFAPFTHCCCILPPSYASGAEPLAFALMLFVNTLRLLKKWN